MFFIRKNACPVNRRSPGNAPNQAGDERTITIKGIDEADNLRGEVSWVSPIARALLKARVGDEVRLQTPGGLEVLEVLEVRYPSPQGDSAAH